MGVTLIGEPVDKGNIGGGIRKLGLVFLMLGCVSYPVQTNYWAGVYEEWLVDLCMLHDDRELEYCECILENVKEESPYPEEVFWTWSRDKVMSYNNGC